ncbi:Uncharacterised protein [Vibrio cholerae]|nr:Uncharacterised protein [Vibrio cholerae]
MLCSAIWVRLRVISSVASDCWALAPAICWLKDKMVLICASISLSICCACSACCCVTRDCCWVCVMDWLTLCAFFCN